MIPLEKPAWMWANDGINNIGLWQTEALSNRQLGYSLRIPMGWDVTPEVCDLGVQVTHIYTGSTSTDWLVISQMHSVRLETPLEAWVDGSMSLVNFPIEIMVAREASYELLQWSLVNPETRLMSRLRVDQLVLFEGLGPQPHTPGEYVRLYVLLAQRGGVAWRVALSLASHCLPATPYAVVIENDHVRAGQTFGTLCL
jgi:hypothetical protein